MVPTLYMLRASPPVRAVLITAKAVGLEMNHQPVDHLHYEHMKPDFLNLNPQHTIPTFVDDDGFSIWDSHAIMMYIVSKYGRNDDLYPDDLKKRAVINQRLFFESEKIFYHLRNIVKPIVFYGSNTIDAQEKEWLVEACRLFEKFLEGNKWAAGDFVSIADHSLIASISTMNSIIPIDSEEYPNITAWMKRCEELPEYEANRKGLKEASDMINIRLAVK